MTMTREAKAIVTAEAMRIAETILQQLGGTMFSTMTGAKNFAATGRGLRMRVGSNSKGVTHVDIQLNDADLYDVTYWRIRGTAEPVLLATSENLYFDALVPDFERETGMYAKL